MKLMIAIVQNQDTEDLIDTLNLNEIQFTKLASTGGFLNAGNTTLLIATENEKIDTIIELIKEVCNKRKAQPPSTTFLDMVSKHYHHSAKEVEVEGAIIFVIDINNGFFKV